MKRKTTLTRCIHCRGTGTLFNDDFTCPCTEGIQGDELEVMVALMRTLFDSLQDESRIKTKESREALLNFISKK